MSQDTEHPHDNDPFLESGPFAAWAGSHGLDAHTGLAITACALGHLAEGCVMFNDMAGFSGMPAPSFLGLESDLAVRAAVASLTAPIAGIQHALTLKSKDYEPADIEAALTECNRMHTKASDDLEGRDDFQKSPDEQAASDLRVSRRSVRHESLTHPLMVMVGSPPHDLGQALGCYHFARAFLAGGVEQLPRDERRRNQRLEEIARFVRGAEISRPGRSRAPQERVTASLRGIMMLPDTQFEDLLDNRRDFLSLFIPVASDPSALLPTDVDPDEVDDFHRMFSRTAHVLIACRRALAPAYARFVHPEWLAHYMGLRRDFLRECNSLPAELRTPAIISLPDLLAWTLVRFSNAKLGDDDICNQAFATARHMRERAWRMYLAHDKAREAAKSKQLAERLIRRLIQVGPCKRRKLVRGSDDMRLIVHEPVISVLLQMGVFVEAADKTLTIGQVPTKSLPPTLFIETPALP